MKRELPLAVALTLLASSVAQALGLGPIERRSALNEPFEARIPITGATAEDLDTLRVSLAGPDAFRRAGIERGLLATRLRFELVQPPSGADFIRVTTRDPVGEPFVSFLIELNWAAGRLFREYTALLDPPNYERSNLQVKAPAPATAAPAAPKAVAPAPGPAPVARAPAPAEASPPAPGGAPDPEPFSGEVRVESGDTLWGLADPVARRAGVSTAQALVALWRANPDAFVAGNMNALRAGAILRLPDSSALAGISNSEALALMAQQNELWQEYRSGRATTAPSAPAAVAAPEPVPAPAAPAEEAAPSPATADAPADDPTLELLAPTPEDASAAGDAGLRKELELSREEIESRQAENDDLRARLDEAERLIAQLERALEVRNDELSQLQGALGRAPDEAPAGGEASADAAPAAPAEGDLPMQALEETPEASTGEPAVADAPEEDADADPLAILERDLEASASGTDILGEEAQPADEAPADDAAEPMVDGPAEAAPDAMVDAPAEAAPDAMVDAPATEPPPAPAPAPAPAAPTDALTRWAESVVPPDLARAVPGGPVAVLGAAGAAVLALLGLLGARMGRRRRPLEVADTPKPAAARKGGAASADTEATQPGVPAATLAATAAATASAGAAAEATDLTDVPLEERTLEATARELAGDAPAANEVDDLLTEVNVYLAYEQFDQAESLVRRAIDQAPQDARRHQYLLDIFYAKGDVAAFEKAALTLRDLTGGTGPAWEDALKRWQELAPGREIFSDAGDEPFDVASQRTFVDLTAAELKPAPATPDADLTVDSARTVDATEEEDAYSATATYAPGELPIAPPPAAPDAPAPGAPADLDLDLGLEAEVPHTGLAGAPSDAAGAGAGTEAAPEAEEAFFDLTADDGGLDFADDSVPTPTSEAAAEAADFDPSAGDELTLVDITGGALEGSDVSGSDLIDITASAGDVTGSASQDGGDVLDVTGGGEPSEDDLGTVRLEPQGQDPSAEFTRGLDPSTQLLDITATGATPGRDLQDILDVSLDGGGLGDLLDVSGPTSGTAGAIDTSEAAAAPEEAPASLDVPLEFDVTGLAQGGSEPLPAEAPEGTLGLPSIQGLEGADFALEGDQNLGDTFDRPQSMLGAGEGDDDTQGLDELAQALEETANRLSAPSAVPSLEDFSSTFSGAMPQVASGSGDGMPAPEVPEPGDLGAIDFDLLGGSEPAPQAGQSGADAAPAGDDDALSLEDLEAALAGGFQGGEADHAGDPLEAADLGDLSSADSWLNLAHAYIEIGDPASAREELERVLAEGNAEQQAQARQLLEQIKD